MPQQFRRLLLSLASLLAFVVPISTGRLAIVVDDFDYRPHTENQVLTISSTIPVAVLPSAPHVREMAIKARDNGHEVLIHLLMALLSKQPLEKDMLRPEMSSEEIERTIRDAVSKVSDAVGLNNHIGSTVTSSLPGIQKVMQALERYDLYFLDSMTISNSQAVRAALGAGVKVIKHRAFLGDTQNEADTHRQFNHVVGLARRSDSTIATGHPYPSTVRVLQQILYNLPADIMLARPSSLLNGPQVDISRSNLIPPKDGTPDAPHNPFRGVKLYKPKQPLEPVYASRFFSMSGENITQSTLAQYMRLQWQG